MFRRLLSGLAFLPFLVHAQLSHGGEPLNWGSRDLHPLHLPATELGPVDRAASIAATDTAGAAKGFRFGVQRLFSADVVAQGQWSDLPGGGRVCRYEVRSTGAVMLALQFSAFHIPWGGELFVYDAARTHFLGAFTQANESPDGRFATALLPGDDLVLEYREPAGAPPAQLLLEGLTHAWRDFFPGPDPERDLDPGYQSLPCHNNVACPIAADWQDQVHATLWFVMPSGLGCSASLLNNTLQDGTPYVLTANHCYQPTQSQWVFYFNYQSPTCVGDTGQTVQTLTGATFRASDYYGDFCLVELFNTPPPAYNAYYAGWDHSGNTPQSGAVVMHPQGDVKKISFYSEPAVSATTPDGLSTSVWQFHWSSGLMEAGASGAPMFDQNKRLVAHMVGGEQVCATATTIPSYGSKFSENWDFGPTPATRLRDWLDPANTSTVLDGYDPDLNAPALKVRVKAMLKGPYVQANGNMGTGINDANELPLTEPYTALGYQLVGSGGESTTQAVFDAIGDTRVVDWVLLELRDPNVPGNTLASRAALLLKNGSIVDMDGVSDVSFPGLAAGPYYVAVRHRNHLGVMTAVPQQLSTTASLIDLSIPNAQTYGGTAATALVGTTRCLWSGDLNGDGHVDYTGPTNDRDPILVKVGSSLPTGVFNGYALEDLNMDGKVKYTGSKNDRDPILVNLGGLPTNVLTGTLP